MLLGLKRTKALLEKIRTLSIDTSVPIRTSIQTNGTLITRDWCETFKTYNVSLGISIDGPKEVHDSSRRDFKGCGSFDKIIKGLKLLRDNDVPFGILSVCDPASDPEIALKFFFEELNLIGLDILIPDITHDEKPQNISNYYKRLFDVWVSKYANEGRRIRFFENIISSILGKGSRVETIGYSVNNIVTIDSDGEIMLLDTLKICKGFEPSLGLNVLTNSIEDIYDSDAYKEILREALTLNSKCISCQFNISCGGGYLPHRWNSKTNNFRNPSVYCEDLLTTMSHIKSFMESDLEIETI